jgi:hypothetical protein
MAFRLLARLILPLLACVGFVSAAAAETPVNLRAHYDIYMTRIRIGEITWAMYFAEQTYQTSANGKASGVFSVLLDGEGSVTTHGAMTDGKLYPAKVTTVVIDDEGRTEVRMTFDNGALKNIDDRGPPPKPDRIKVTPNLLHDVTDPLSAMLIPVSGDAFAHANCDRTLRIFDGRRRYNLALSYKRTDKMDAVPTNGGKVLVCGVVLRPIAGYDPDSLLVRYLAGKSDLELWFAPVADAAVLAPVRALMPTLVGTLEIRATKFAPKAKTSTKEQAKPH